ncbi:O-antigen ligase family protein [Bradyrhizobium jicamae]|uniref:O-antigen ligase family protein n=1 Tax=Bradyrhizobium jicamae TaxID=280332 RepID=UPI001BAD2C67|nr:O-antigen ligase family protein [Bradyrhizobium jicamae]MBR0757049.1 O-antigen ligase family protein [Bradyrhizobium jicamae]
MRFALAPLLLTFLEKQRRYLVAAFAALSLAFLCNMTFVVVARIAFVYWPVMAVVFAVRYWDRKYCLPVLAVGTGIVMLSLVASPYMRDRIARTIADYRLDQQTDIATSSGERLFYWRTASQAIAEAPIFGHGTGSTGHILAKAAEHKTGEWANIVRSPHSQTLYVAVQWGLLGCFVLFALWYVHFMLFFNRSSYVAWIGLIVVVQNLVSSLVNSHLFDFHEGWLYVIGVGVAGGMLTSHAGISSSEPA